VQAAEKCGVFPPALEATVPAFYKFIGWVPERSVIWIFVFFRSFGPHALFCAMDKPEFSFSPFLLLT